MEFNLFFIFGWPVLAGLSLLGILLLAGCLRGRDGNWNGAGYQPKAGYGSSNNSTPPVRE